MEEGYKIVDEKVVSYKMAAQLKNAGFDERVLGIYMYTPASSVSKGGYFNHYKSYVHHSNTEWQELFQGAKESLYKGMDVKHPYISAPTHCQVLDWLQDKYRLFVYVTFDENMGWSAYIRSKDINTALSACGTDRYDAYECAFNWILRRIFNLR
jgi:hypothetical protein